jgi:lysylphosphatidylglycerol synthetase-like protein (DUF2156 family)
MGMPQAAEVWTAEQIRALPDDGLRHEVVDGEHLVTPAPRLVHQRAVDLMRHRSKAPPGAMDYLFTKLFLQLKEKGFARFNLGMAPMSGFRENEDASIEEKAIHAFFQHLNFLFSYRGLKRYKAKFADSWEPRYAIYRAPIDLARMAMALSRVSEIRRVKRREPEPFEEEEEALENLAAKEP